MTGSWTDLMRSTWTPPYQPFKPLDPDRVLRRDKSQLGEMMCCWLGQQHETRDRP